MARDRGQIRKRGEERYLIRVYLGRVDGKRKYKSKTVYGDEEHAEKELTKMLRRKDRGLLKDTPDETLATFADEWLETKEGQVKPSTYTAYERYVRKHIKPGIGHLQMEDVNSRLIQGFINDLEREKDLSAGYIRQIHTCLQMILKKAVKWDLIATNPAAGGMIDLPKDSKTKHRTLDEEEIGKFLEATRGTRLHAFFVLLVSTGLRPGEAFALKWKDLDDEGWLHVRRVVHLADDEADEQYEVSDSMKTESSRRRIKLGEGVMQVMESHRARQAEEKLAVGPEYEDRGFIFTRGPRSNRPGRFIYREYARRRFKKALREAGLPADEIRLYDLRHTHISRLILDGVDLKLASSRAGHSSIQQTADTYAHLTEEAEEHMADVTEQMLEAAL